MIENSHKTKIVATMGPATASADVLEAMFAAGLDICRINFSHGNYDAVKEIMLLNLLTDKKLQLQQKKELATIIRYILPIHSFQKM